MIRADLGETQEAGRSTCMPSPTVSRLVELGMELESFTDSLTKVASVDAECNGLRDVCRVPTDWSVTLIAQPLWI